MLCKSLTLWQELGSQEPPSQPKVNGPDLFLTIFFISPLSLGLDLSSILLGVHGSLSLFFFFSLICSKLVLKWSLLPTAAGLGAELALTFAPFGRILARGYQDQVVYGVRLMHCWGLKMTELPDTIVFLSLLSFAFSF